MTPRPKMHMEMYMCTSTPAPQQYPDFPILNHVPQLRYYDSKTITAYVTFGPEAGQGRFLGFSPPIKCQLLQALRQLRFTELIPS